MNGEGGNGQGAASEERPGSRKSVGGSMLQSNPMALKGSGEFPFFPVEWSYKTCNKCGKVGHLSTVCALNEHRVPFDEVFIRTRRMAYRSAMGVAMYTTTAGCMEGLTETTKDQFMSIMRRGSEERTGEGVERGLVGDAHVAVVPEVLGEGSWSFGIPRTTVVCSHITPDSGATNCMMSAKCVERLVAQGTPIHFMRWTNARRVLTGAGPLSMELAVRVIMRLPIEVEVRKGEFKCLGHMPVPLTCIVNPLLPVDMLLGNTTILEYNMHWVPWSGRMYMTCPMHDNMEVFVQMAMTPSLGLMMPMVTYESGPEGQSDLCEEWHGTATHKGHKVWFPHFQQQQWSEYALKLRYDRWRVPDTDGVYKDAAQSREQQADPYAFRADGTTNGIWRVKGKQRGMVHSDEGKIVPHGCAMYTQKQEWKAVKSANKFEVLSVVEEEAVNGLSESESASAQQGVTVSGSAKVDRDNW